jgi:protein SCO1/2
VRKALFTITLLAGLALSGSALAASTPPLVGHAAKAGGTILDVPIPKELLAIPLTEGNGKSFTLASLKGKTVVMTDFLTLCNEICPMTSINMREIGDAISKAKLTSSIVSLELTVDPKRDSAMRLHAYQALFSDPSWTVATGSPKGISDIWSWFGAYSQVVPAEKGITDWMTGKPIAYDVNHADVIVIIGPDLHWRWLDLGAPSVTNPKAKNAIPSKLYTYLSSTGKANLLRPEQPFWSTSSVYSALDEIFKIKIGQK